MTSPPLLEMRRVSKSYGEAHALVEASFDLASGEVHALVGENGAGKSTLVKILSGAVDRDAGDIRLDGEPAELRSPSDAVRLGIGMIYQDLQLVPELSVAENVVLGNEPTVGRWPFLDRAAAERRAETLVTQLGQRLDPSSRVADLSVAHRQIVAIARALSRRVRVLVLDEPTAPLTAHETANLFRVLGRLRAEGVGVVYISHRLEEIFEIADRVTVLRDGRLVLTTRASDIDRGALIRAMVGRDLDRRAPRVGIERGPELLRVEGLVSGRMGPVSLVLHRAEVLGIAGLVGSGRTDLIRAIFGAERREAGAVLLEGRPVAPRSPREAIALGIGLLTEDRDRLGLVGSMNVRENVTLASLRSLSVGGFLSRARETAAAMRRVDELRIRPADVEAPVAHLSGGNRQKVVLARWLETSSRVLMFDEPTAGVDVGARTEIHAAIRRLAEDGVGVIVVSSDLEEILEICDRVVVLCHGRVAGELPAQEATQEAILHLAAAEAVA